MYKEQITQFIDSHKEEMIKDICTLCCINSERMTPSEGKPVSPDALGDTALWGSAPRTWKAFGFPGLLARRDGSDFPAIRAPAAILQQISQLASRTETANTASAQPQSRNS